MTIYALSSGPGISGVAVIRVSGPEAKIVIQKMTKEGIPIPRIASLSARPMTYPRIGGTALPMSLYFADIDLA